MGSAHRAGRQLALLPLPHLRECGRGLSGPAVKAEKILYPFPAGPTARLTGLGLSTKAGRACFSLRVAAP